MVIRPDPGSNHNMIYTGSHDGIVCSWDAETGDNDKVAGISHTNQVSDMTMDGKNIYSAGLDDTVRTLSMATNEYISQIKMDSQPRGISSVPDKNVLIVAGFSDLTVLNTNGSKQSVVPVKFEPSCVHVHPSNQDVAIGSGSPKVSKVHIYNLSGVNLVPKKELDHRDSITDVKYSPDGTYLAASDSSRRVVLYNATNYEVSKPH